MRIGAAAKYSGASILAPEPILTRLCYGREAGDPDLTSDLWKACNESEGTSLIETVRPDIKADWGAQGSLTDRKQAEGALRSSEERFRSVFENAAIGMGRVRFVDARWIEVNDAFCNIVGYTREELEATPWPEITHPEDIDKDLIPFRGMAAGELDNYSVEDLRRELTTKKGCAPRCTVACVHYTSYMDFWRAPQTIASPPATREKKSDLIQLQL